jgi:hypothetical protein
VDQGAANRLHREEVAAAEELLVPNQTQIGFIDQSGGVEGVAPSFGGKLPQFVKDEQAHLRGGLAVAGLGRFKKAVDFGHDGEV